MKNGLILIFLLLVGPDEDIIKKPEGRIVIGFSQCTMVDAWRQEMVEEMKREIIFHRDFDIDLIIKDANDNNSKQIEDIRDLINRKIDILIVSPNEADQLTPVVEEVFNKGIPVIVIDRKINSSQYSAFIGADNLSIGREAGYFASELLHGKGKILEIAGLKGSTPAIERSKGFHEIINNNPGITIVKTIEGSWLEEKTLRITDSLFRIYRDFDLIFAHNDFMASAASKSAIKYNIKPYIIGVDGMNVSDGGVDMVIKGLIDGTIFYPTGGEKAIQIAIAILTKEKFEKNNTLNTFRIDKSNARTIWLQGQQIQDQLSKIDKLNDHINNMSSLLTRRNTLLLLGLTLIILLIAGVIAIFISLRNKNRMNKLLDEKNKTINNQNKIITKQRDDSINLLIVAEEAKENKLRLFTDLSHEFRTIVTLITNPVNELLRTVNDESTKSKLRVLQRSSERLARLTDGILKFRNIDENKYHLVFIKGNLSEFLENIIEAFEEQAKEKNIRIISNITKNIYAEYDAGVLEKVMYNLLSNAIKYNRYEGSVSISMRSESFNILIDISDTGIGISSNDLPFIFNRFYKTINNNTSNDKIGIGLALTKELLQLHGGKITVNSVENKGTTFSIVLPQFHQTTDNFNKAESTTQAHYDAKSRPDPGLKKSVLIVEDNPDVLIVLADIISKYYGVITARNGREGLDITLKKSPDLIVSDILMPVMDGMQMCIEIKKHLATCHIPIILLTAIDSQENIIKGFEIGADAYITKPFNESLLLSNIKNLIESRENLKKFFCPSPFFRNLIEKDNNRNEDFLRKCLNNIYENLENEDYSMSTLSEKMNMSRSTLYRRIKEISSIKPVDFLKKAKLNYAAKLLTKGTIYNINEVAWRCGFNDVKYFSKCFTQEFGVNPSQYYKDWLKTQQKKYHAEESFN
ncbi:MAG: substrate-binding domain-containing protein [Candidatus Methanofastidiosum sp.]|nr:substrate-binding domain-containing protein [Methanofastidiosum sp.]